MRRFRVAYSFKGIEGGKLNKYWQRRAALKCLL